MRGRGVEGRIKDDEPRAVMLTSTLRRTCLNWFDPTANPVRRPEQHLSVAKDYPTVLTYFAIPHILPGTETGASRTYLDITFFRVLDHIGAVLHHHIDMDNYQSNSSSHPNLRLTKPGSSEQNTGRNRCPSTILLRPIFEGHCTTSGLVGGLCHTGF